MNTPHTTAALAQSLPPRIPFWEHLTASQRQQVLARTRTVHYPAGQLVHSRDTECPGMLCLVQGALRVYLLSAAGRELTLYHIRSGEACVLAASCVLDAIYFDMLVEAAEDTEACLVPADLFAALLRENIYVERDTYRMATERFSDVVLGMERLLFDRVDQRVAAFLLETAAKQGSDTLHITHEQIATQINSAREVVSRTLKQMAAQGAIRVFRGGLRIDRAALRAVAAGDGDKSQT